MENYNLFEKCLITIYHAINENKWAGADHHRVQIKEIKPLVDVLLNKGYKCKLISKVFREEEHINYDMILRRSDNVPKHIKIVKRRASTKSEFIMLPIGNFSGSTYTLFEDPTVDEICFICHPFFNYQPNLANVDNTKACFFDKDDVLQAYVDNSLEAKKTKDGTFLMIPERWAKNHAKELIPYKYQDPTADKVQKL